MTTKEAFEAVRADPEYTMSSELYRGEWSADVMRFIVDLYLESTGNVMQIEDAA